MLIEPQAAQLLARICDTLESTALADMAAPYAQRQLKAGLYALRDVGARVAAQPRWIRDDIDDMTAVLATLGADLSGQAVDASTDVERHLQLQASVEAFEATLDGPGVTDASRAAASRQLRALYARMLERERAARADAAVNVAG